MRFLPRSARARRLLLSFVLTLAVWVCVSWPLPAHFSSGVPCASENVEIGAKRAMVAGDHLQFLYYLWQEGEALFGRVAPFHDVHQFNTGSDVGRFVPRLPFLPFCYAFALLSKVGGRAFGYNVTAFLSLWMTCLASWLLARRYTTAEWAAAAAAVLGLLVPYRWISLLGGSPMGLAMLWIPCLLLGLDIAIRDLRLEGGVLAGISLVMAYAGDVQMFFFAAFCAPFWGMIALARSPRLRRLEPRAWLVLSRVLFPLAVCAAFSGVLVYLRKTVMLGTSTARGGRSWHELALYSPRSWLGLFTWRPDPGPEHHIHLGWALPALAVAGVAVLAARAARRPREEGGRAALAFTLLAACVACLLLALGAHGPFGGRLVDLCRRFVPFFSMIRQSTKVYCLMPTLLTVLSAVALTALVPRPRLARPAAVAGLCLLAMAAAVPAFVRIRATVCVLDSEQPAYRAVAEDAAARGRQARCVIVPLWPGDSAWASLYQHYVSLYRIRMLNGYSPFISAEYRRDVFDRFQGINQGRLTTEDIAELEKRGIGYVLLHENAFPQRVSPFTSGYTLRALLEHPRLELLASGGGAWSFRIVERPADKAPALPGCAFFTPTRGWGAERCARADTHAVADPACAGGGFVRMERASARLETGPVPRPPRIPSLPGLRWTVRARGAGALAAAGLVDGATNRVDAVKVSAADWTWTDIPAASFDGTRRVGLRLALVDGRVDVDCIMLVEGRIPEFAPGEAVEIPAESLFHWAATDASNGGVTLSAARNHQNALRGPSIPMPAGTYRVEMVFSSPAPPGTDLGFLVATDGRHSSPRFGVTAGRRAVGRFAHGQNLPVDVLFRYTRLADVTVHRLVFTRLP